MSSLFGTSQQSAFSFPAQATSSAAPAFGVGQGQSLFGAPASSAPGASSLFSFGQPLTTSSTSAFSPYGSQQPSTTSAASSLGLGGPGATNFSFFATPAQQLQQSSLFGTAQKTTQSTGLFNFPSTQTMAPSQPQQQTGQFGSSAPVNVDNLANFISSLTNPAIFGDERDKIIANFNQLQAFCGFGKGFFSQTTQPFDYTPDNPFCRLKSVCYNRLDGSKDEDGFLGFIIKKSENDVKSNLQLILDEFSKILGKKPEITIAVEAIKPLPENKCEIVIYITETTPIGSKRRILATESYAYFNQPTIRQQLSQNLLVEQILLKVVSSVDKMKEYLAVPQGGLDVLLWNQAIAENPDPNRLIPYPILGFKQLKERQIMQKLECDMHDSCLKELTKKLELLEQRIILKQTKLMEFKSMEKQLSHKLLVILGKHFMQIRRGFSFEVNEENLKSILETVYSHLNGSSQFKIRLAEISSQLKLKRGQIQNFRPTKCSDGDEDLIIEMKQYLRKCQDAIENLATTVRKDQKDLNMIQKVMTSSK